jgi:2,4-dienoyl-CoA reductase-like NADH-dependent reductase (Old Yellow Enzyme family)
MKVKKMEFPNLFSRIKINGMEVKNRIVMTAMHLGYTPEGFVTDRLVDFYSLRARGGVGLIIVGGCPIDEQGSMSGMIRIDHDRDLFDITGDANGPRKAMDAIREGFMAGLRI